MFGIFEKMDELKLKDVGQYFKLKEAIALDKVLRAKYGDDYDKTNYLDAEDLQLLGYCSKPELDT